MYIYIFIFDFSKRNKFKYIIINDFNFLSEEFYV